MNDPEVAVVVHLFLVAAVSEVCVRFEHDPPLARFRSWLWSL